MKSRKNFPASQKRHKKREIFIVKNACTNNRIRKTTVIIDDN